MKKIEFESEEQLDDFLYAGVHHRVKNQFDVDRDINIELMKEHGYFKKSDLEIARKIYYRKLNDPTKNSIDSYTELVKYKNELEKEIEMLKGEK